MRLRVSTLEAYRRLLQTEYGDEAELAERMRRGQWTDDGQQKWQMLAGTAWHRALAGEAPDAALMEQKPAVYRYGGYWFAEDDIEAGRSHVGAGVKEVTGSIQLAGAEIEGTCDTINGLVIQDAKTKFSYPSAKDYESSLQWRLYLLIFGAKRFQYNLFCFRDPDSSGFCALTNVIQFCFWAYPQMQADCERWVREFLAWNEQTLEAAVAKGAS